MAPLSLEDIMDFMKNDKEERTKERESDKQEMKELICNGVKEEVEKTIKPIQDRQNDMERNQADMKEQFNDMINEVKDLKSKLLTPSVTSCEYPPLPTLYPLHSSSQYGNTYRASEHQVLDPKVADIIDNARRTVGLHKIDRDDLNRMKLEQYGGASNEEEEKLLAVKEYLKCELKLNQNEIENMVIENIFIPASERDDPQSLNVTFKTFSSVSKIHEKTRIMRRESRIKNYIPRQFRDRLNAISEFDYNLRLDKKYQTRIKMGMLDLELHKKLRGTSKWGKVILPNNLPPVDLNSRPATPLSKSPPSGRPGHEYNRDKRGRESTGSGTGQNNSKVAKQTKNSEEVSDVKTAADREKSWVEAVENADLVSDEPASPVAKKGSQKISDPGNFISIQGTPAKMLSGQAFTQSPIHSRSGRKPLL